MSLKSIYKKTQDKKRRAIVCLLWQYKNIPTGKRRKLDKNQKKEADRLWKTLQYRKNHRWHELFYAVRGRFEAEIVPPDAFYLSILPKLNHSALADAWSDKNYASEVFFGLPMPETLLKCIDKRLYTSEYSPVSISEAVEMLRSAGEKVLVKPSLNSGIGKGVSIFETADLKEEELRKILRERNGNCIFQRLIRQCEQLRKLNSSSINIIRVISLRLNDWIYTLNATVRFGNPGEITDISKDAHGTETMNLLGMTEDGTLHDVVYHYDGSTTASSDYGVQSGEKLMAYEKVIKLSQEAHKRLLHFDFVGFDIAIDENNEPLIIEANIGTPGIFAYQYVHGPLFKDQLSAVLDLCKK